MNKLLNEMNKNKTYKFYIIIPKGDGYAYIMNTKPKYETPPYYDYDKTEHESYKSFLIDNCLNYYECIDGYMEGVEFLASIGIQPKEGDIIGFDIISDVKKYNAEIPVSIVQCTKNKLLLI